MSDVIRVVTKLFNSIFVAHSSLSNTSFLRYIINHILTSPYLYLGAVLLVIGFSVGIIKRIIHS